MFSCSVKANEMIPIYCVYLDTQQMQKKKNVITAAFYLTIWGLVEASRPSKALCL